jgi:formylglycine-generating enzyme required for sulfatase activity
LSKSDRVKVYYEILGDQVQVPDLHGPGYRLPTEAEWEYACRAVTMIRPSFGDDASEPANFAWYKENSDNKTHPVGQRRPNTFGLFDMQGNVWEWCWDWYHDEYYRKSPIVDPQGPAEASRRVLRGGCWDNNPRLCRPAGRSKLAPGVRFSGVGFRLALGPSGR